MQLTAACHSSTQHPNMPSTLPSQHGQQSCVRPDCHSNVEFVGMECNEDRAIDWLINQGLVLSDPESIVQRFQSNQKENVYQIAHREEKEKRRMIMGEPRCINNIVNSNLLLRRQRSICTSDLMLN